MKRGIVNPDLLEERAKCVFDQKELLQFALGKDRYELGQELYSLVEKNPELMGEAKEYEMTREELMENCWKKTKLMNELDGGKWIINSLEHMQKFF